MPYILFMTNAFQNIFNPISIISFESFSFTYTYRLAPQCLTDLPFIHIYNNLSIYICKLQVDTSLYENCPASP